MSAVQDLELVKEGFKAVLGWPYQSPNAVILPYSEKHQDVFPEEFLGTLYFRLKSDDLLATIFPGMDMSHVNKFITYMSRVRGFVICCEKTATKPRPVGLGWLSEVDRVKGSFGFGYFKEFHRKRLHVDLSFLQLKYWFEEFSIPRLYGTSLNPVAINYSKRFGFEYIRKLPGFFDCNGTGVDAHLITLEKKVFCQYYELWKYRSEQS